MTQATDPRWLAEARKLVGLKEVIGSRHESKVVKFFAEAGHAGVKDDETAWCAAFANAMLKRGGIKGTGLLNARSFLGWGKKLTKPRLGAIAVFKRGNSTWQGHVAFFIREVGAKIEVLGGNQSNAVSIAKYPKSALLGYRWPSDAAVPADTELAPRVPRPRPTEPVQRALDKDKVMEVQQALRDLGFPEVGNVDGKIGLAGSRTRGAISSYRASRGLPLLEEIDDELLADIENAKVAGWKREVSVERATATKADLPDSAVLQNTDRAKRHIGLSEKIMLWFGIGAPAAGGAVEFLDADKIDERLGLLQRFGAFAAENWWIAIVLVGVGVSVFYMRRASKRVDVAEDEEVQGYREGRHV